MVVTIVAELASTGSVSTGVFQMLSAGSTGQPPITCCAEAGAASAATITAVITAARIAAARVMAAGHRNRRAGRALQGFRPGGRILTNGIGAARAVLTGIRLETVLARALRSTVDRRGQYVTHSRLLVWVAALLV